jgi:Xaa-Pro aminopeptidase
MRLQSPLWRSILPFKNAIDARQRVNSLREAVLSSSIAPELHTLLVTSPTNIQWLTGFTGSSGMVVIPMDDNSLVELVTDGRYVEQATQEVTRVGANVAVVEKRTAALMREHVGASLGGAVGYEASDMSVEVFTQLRDVAKQLHPKTFVDNWNSISSVFAEVRRCKTAAEVERIAFAASIADQALAKVLPLLVPGISERNFRDELDQAMRQGGADDVSFTTIVAFGVNSALAHHRPSHYALQADDAVVVDFGALVEGYHSDMTRSFVAGEATSPRAQELLKRHEAVSLACTEGAKLVRPGCQAREIDARCREVLAQYGLEDELTHGVGHGVGLQIHESPWVNAHSRDVLRPGDVVTVEPGAYRVGVGGARVEDLLVVTETAHTVLSLSPKDPQCPL